MAVAASIRGLVAWLGAGALVGAPSLRVVLSSLSSQVGFCLHRLVCVVSRRLRLVSGYGASQYVVGRSCCGFVVMDDYPGAGSGPGARFLGLSGYGRILWCSLSFVKAQDLQTGL